MRRLARVIGYLTAILGGVLSLWGQDRPQPEVILTKLTAPVYPPLARMASIVGEVRVEVKVRQDGSVASADVISGHPMMKQAALDSAQSSTFECHDCVQPLTTLLLTYDFERKDDGDCCNGLSRAPEVTHTGTNISVVAPAICLCDPSATVTRRVRSPKCLWLWKCGVSER